MSDLIEILKEERAVIRQEAGALWRNLSRILFTLLVISLVILLLALGHSEGPRLRGYESALEEYGNLIKLRDDLKQEWFEEDITILECLQGKELAVLGDAPLKEILVDLKKLEEAFEGGVPTKGVKLKQVIKNFDNAIKVNNNDPNYVAIVEPLKSQIEAKPIYSELLWDEAMLASRFNEVIKKAIGYISTIQMNLPSITPVNKYRTSELPMEELMAQIKRDLETVFREISELRIVYQGLEFAVPVTVILFWYPVALFLFAFVILVIILKARKGTDVFRQLSVSLQKGGSPQLKGQAQENKYPFIQLKSPHLRFQTYHFILLLLFVFVNFYILFYLDRALKNMLPTLFRATRDQGKSLLLFDHGTWRLMLILLGILLVAIIIVKLFGSFLKEKIMNWFSRKISQNSKICSSTPAQENKADEGD